ncbi:ion channel [Isoptericola sp. b441]|uniref:Ion channel n=1 Tax=Actinotalea lenta TaxID=3064654 RepID=A0ABT9D9M9_9CELL|nr:MULTISPECIES: potassium channel family protein [unclassified Isoptericola]MDO8107196.1 ion channel [Isoptericola sp. b441]MDO8121126.1 ion channel [Isoptericola sp. b490]
MRLDRYESRTSGPMTALALVFLAVYAVVVIQTGFPRWVVSVATALNLAIWVLFALDLAVRLWLAENKVRWILRHPVDVASVVVPALRPLRALRIFSAGQNLMSRRGSLLQTGQAILLAAGILVLVGALAELDAEKNAAGSLITNIGDALWWALATVTTVGYGDLYPVTTPGRIVASALMIVGISVLGVVTASVAAWFVDMAESARKGADEEGGSHPEVPEPQSPSALLDTDARALLGALRRAGVLTDDEVTAAVARLPAEPPEAG